MDSLRDTLRSYERGIVLYDSFMAYYIGWRFGDSRITAFDKYGKQVSSWNLDEIPTVADVVFFILDKIKCVDYPLTD